MTGGKNNHFVCESTHGKYGWKRIADRLGDHFFGCPDGLFVWRADGQKNRTGGKEKMKTILLENELKVGN